MPLLLLAAFFASPLFCVDYSKPQELAALFAQEQALSYIVYSPKGIKQEFTLSLKGEGLQKTFALGKTQGTASLKNGMLTLSLNGRENTLSPKVFAGGTLVLWVQLQPLVRIIVPASFKKLPPLAAELEALDPMGGGYEEGYEEEGE